MSIVVNINADMPEKCADCPFCSCTEPRSCIVTKHPISLFDRGWDCPIIAELPEEHNDFIELPSVIGWDKSDVKRYQDTFVGGAMWLFDKLTEREVKIPAEYKSENK